MKRLSILAFAMVISACSPEASLVNLETVEVTVGDLIEAYDANEAAAQTRYNGVRLIVTGTVSEINLGSDDLPFLNLGWKNTLLPVQASFRAGHESAANSMAKGEIVRLECGEVGEILGTPMLRECVAL